MGLALNAAGPDLTLQEIRNRLRARGIIVAASSVWRFCDRHDLTFKERLHAAEQERADVAPVRELEGRSAAVNGPRNLPTFGLPKFPTLAGVVISR